MYMFNHLMITFWHLLARVAVQTVRLRSAAFKDILKSLRHLLSMISTTAAQRCWGLKRVFNLPWVAGTCVDAFQWYWTSSASPIIPLASDKKKIFIQVKAATVRLFPDLWWNSDVHTTDLCVWAHLRNSEECIGACQRSCKLLLKYILIMLGNKLAFN